MPTNTATLEILLQIQDLASQALEGFGSKTKNTLDSIQSSANTMAATFGLAGGAILGALGLMVNSASEEQTAFEKLGTAVDASIALAQSAAGSDSTLASQKKLLTDQLTGVNAKLAEYEQKAMTSKGATGLYATEIANLVVQQGNLQNKLADLNNMQTLAGMNAKDVTQKLEEQAEANTSLGFTVEDSAGSLQMFLTATHSVSEAMILNQTAMDLSRAKGEDLLTATQQVTMAYEGNGKALKQFGINLKDGVTNMQAVQELGQAVTGQAANFAKTMAGQMDVASAKTDELSAAVGNGLLPALTQALTALVPLIDKMTEWINQHPQLTTDILLAVGALGGLLVVLASIAGAISGAIELWKGIQAAIVLGQLAVEGFGVALDFLAANPIVLIIAAIVALGVGIYELITHWQQVKDFTIQVWSDITAWISKYWKDILNILMPGLGSLVGFIVDNMGTISSVWNATWGGIRDFFVGIWDGMENVLSGAIDSLRSQIQNFVSWASGVFAPVQAAVNAIGGAASGFANAAKSAVGAAASVIGVHDAIIQPNGQVIQTDPSDYLIATKTPGSLGRGAGQGVTVNLNGGMYLDSKSATLIANEVAKVIGRSLKLTNF